MNIAAIPSQYAAVANQQSSASPAGIQPGNPYREIASRYDVTNMTEKQTVKLGNELANKGLMNELDMAVMTFRFSQGHIDPSAGFQVKKDDGLPHDYIAQYRSRIAFDEQHGFDSSVLKRILGVLENVQAARGTVNIHA